MHFLAHEPVQIADELLLPVFARLR